MKSVHDLSHRIFRLSLLCSLCFSLAAFAEDRSQDPVVTADSKHFRVTYESKVKPIPLNQIHSWVLHVDTLDSKPVEGADISVYGGMPAHKHGLPTEPVVSETGQGDYLVEGIKFSMNGAWQLWFNIRVGEMNEQVKFDIEF